MKWIDRDRETTQILEQSHKNTILLETYPSSSSASTKMILEFSENNIE